MSIFKQHNYFCENVRDKTFNIDIPIYIELPKLLTEKTETYTSSQNDKYI